MGTCQSNRKISKTEKAELVSRIAAIIDWAMVKGNNDAVYVMDKVPELFQLFE